MILLVCGGRNYADRPELCYWLDRQHAEQPITLLVHGAAPGADELADEWARDRGVPRLAFPADWKQHGKAAGPIRNAQMLRETQPDAVMAFKGGKGTKNMIDQARRAGLTIVTVSD